MRSQLSQPPLIIFCGAALAAVLMSPAARADDDEKGFDERKAARLQFILEEGPDAGPIFDKLYAMHKKAGRLSKLIARYKARVAAGDKEVAPYFILGRLYERERELRAAAKTYRAGLAQAKDLRLERFFQYRLGIVFADLRRFKEAADALLAAEKLAREPDLKSSVLEELGRVYMRTGRRSEGSAAWRRILEIRRRDFFATIHVATLMAKEKLFVEVDRVFREAIAGPFSNDPAAALKLRAKQGEILEAASRYEDAAKAYRAVLARTKSGNWLKRQVKARLRRMYLQIGRAYALIDFYKKSMDERPDDEEPVLDLADAYELMGSQGLARRLLLDRRGRLPQSTILRERLIHLLGGPILYTRQNTILPIAEAKKEGVGEEEGDPLEDEGPPRKKDDKKGDKKDKPQEDPDEQRLARVLEELFFDPGEWLDTRCQLLEELIALRPAESKYYKALATEHLRAERTAEAEAVMARLQKLRAGIEGLLQSAEAYRASGRLDEALQALAKAARMAPGDERPYVQRGEVFLKMNDKPAALAAFARAVGSPDGRATELDAFSQRRLSTLLEEHKLLLDAAWAMARAIKADLDIANRDDLMRAGKLFQRADKPLVAGRWYLKAFEASQDSNERKLTLTLLRETLTDGAQLRWLSRVLKQRCQDLERADPQVVLALAGVIIDQGRPAEAVKLLEEAAGGPPKVRFASEDVFKEADEESPKAKDTPAEAASELGDELPPRVLYLRQLVDLYSGVKGARPDILKAFAALQELARLDRANRWRYALTEGLAQLRRGYRDEAKSIFRRVLAIAPANADVFADLARHFEELKDFPSALEAASKAVDQTPRDGRRHWAHIELIRRHLRGREAEEAHLGALRRFVQSGVNSQDLETARDDLYGLLMRRAESLAARDRLEEAIRCTDEARSLAAADEPRARAQLLGAALQLKSDDPLPALEILQGVVGRFRSSWVVLDRTRVPAAHLAASWLRRLDGRALQAYHESLAPRGRELFEVARLQNDLPLLGRLSRIFPFDPAARARLAEHINALVGRRRYEEALWNLDRLDSTAPSEGPDPHADKARAWRETCEAALGDAASDALPGYSPRPARTLRIDGGLNTGALAAPVIYGERLFYALPGGELRCLLLDRLATPRRPRSDQSPSPLAARYKLGQRTPKSRVIYQLGQPNSYYYYQNGVVGVASLPESLAGGARSEDPARAWRRRLGSVTGMAAVGGRLFVSGRGVQALSPRTGHTLWRYGDPRDQADGDQDARKSAPAGNTVNVGPRGATVSRSPRTMVDLVVSKERIYALAIDGVVAALDPATGEALWSAEGFGTFGNGDLVLRGEGPQARLYIARDDRVSCLSASTGKRLWRSESITSAALRENEVRKRALAKKPAKPKAATKSSRRIITGRMNNAALNFRINMSNPRNKLVYKPSGPNGQRPAPQLMFSGDVLAASNRLGGVVVIKMDDGSLCAARHFDNDPQVALIGERLWIAERQQLSIIDGKTDKEGPKKNLGQNAMGPPILVEDGVLIPTATELLTLDPEDGRVLVREPLDRLDELPTKARARSSRSRRRSSSPPQPTAPESMTLRRLSGAIALRGNRFLLLDPKTGKRRFEFALGSRANRAQARRAYRYGRNPPPQPREPFAAISSPKALCVTDNSGALHIFLARE